MIRWAKKIALVTGASSGNGASIAKKLVKHGLSVIGCARSPDIDDIKAISEELKNEKGKLVPYTCDLRNEDDILEMFKMIKTEYGSLNVCVNNAGLCLNAPLLSGTTEQWRNMIDVNVLAYSICAREALKLMEENHVTDGHIFLINSLAGHRIVPLPKASFYGMTKYAVTHMTESLRSELRLKNSPIRVTAISPGFVETNFAYVLEAGNPGAAEKTYASIKALQPDDIADSLLYALGAPPHVQVHDILVRPIEQVN